MNFFYCNSFFKRFSISSATTDFSFRLSWISPGNFCCRGWGRKGIWYPLQFLKYSDPFSEVPTFLQSVSVFLLPGHLEVDQTRIIILPACEHMVIFLVESEFASPWKRLLPFTNLPLCFVPVIPVKVPALLLAIVFVRYLPPSTMMFAWQGTFPKGMVSTCSVFKNSTCQEFFRLFVSLYCFWYLLTKLFAKKIFIFFLE